MRMWTLYLHEFRRRVDGERFLKVGWTDKWNSLERYSARVSMFYGNSPDQYDAFEITKLKEIKHRDMNTIKELESAILSDFPKDIQIPEYFSGISEIRHISNKQRLLELFEQVEQALTEHQ